MYVMSVSKLKKNDIKLLKILASALEQDVQYFNEFHDLLLDYNMPTLAKMLHSCYKESEDDGKHPICNVTRAITTNFKLDSYDLSCHNISTDVLLTKQEMLFYKDET